jgi:uncharacterized protein (DUF488 family)
VRRFPGSRRHPHFARERLEPLLAAHSIGYRWMPSLGGRRDPRPDSVNSGWRVKAFRGYADYMETAEFGQAFDELLGLASDSRVAIMCAEALWWQCHRRLISDALTARGHEVRHVQSPDSAPPHKVISPAVIRDGRLSYPTEQSGLDL